MSFDALELGMNQLHSSDEVQFDCNVEIPVFVSEKCTDHLMTFFIDLTKFSFIFPIIVIGIQNGKRCGACQYGTKTLNLLPDEFRTQDL